MNYINLDKTESFAKLMACKPFDIASLDAKRINSCTPCFRSC